MGKTYYCDFCDKAFRDNGMNRRNHLRSTQHQRLKKEHYDSFRDIATILAEETLKPPCQNFLRRGHCDFGERCKFSHLTPQTKEAWERQVISQKAKKRAAAEKSAEDFGPKLDKLVSSMNKKYGKDTDTKATEDGPPELPPYKIPPVLARFPNLPPSVLPPKPDALKGLVLEDWG